MKNPLFSSSMFATPDSFKDLQNMIEQYSGYEKSLAYLFSMLTMNMCSKLVQDQIESESAEKISRKIFLSNKVFMNERIKELIEQATTILEPNDLDYRREIFDKEKFAQLIVQECPSLADAHDGQSDYMQLFAPHFGVK